jgi:hypothetical protein
MNMRLGAEQKGTTADGNRRRYARFDESDHRSIGSLCLPPSPWAD